MDAFFAAVEQRERPALRGQPVVVGGQSRRGVVCAASYEARKFGIRSAMPMVEAMAKCPQAHVVAPRHRLYSEVSSEIFAVFRSFTPLVEGLSLDEAFLDVGASQKLFGDAVSIAQQIKSSVKSATGLVASAGVAPCKLVAKIASDLEKPDGLVVVRPGEVQEFLAPLPIERMWGIGQVAGEKLKSVGIHTLGSLASAPRSVLQELVGSHYEKLQARARGEDDRQVVSEHAPKSIGAELTFENDVNDPVELRRYLLRHAEKVARRLNDKGLCGRVVTLKVKYNNFEQRTLRRTQETPISDTDSIYEVVCELLIGVDLSRRPLRLIGLSVSDFVSGGQLVLFGCAEREKREDLQKLSDAIQDRFGAMGITRGSLIRKTRKE